MKFYVRSVFLVITLTAIGHGSRIPAHDFESTVAKCCDRGKDPKNEQCQATKEEIDKWLMYRDLDRLFDACSLSYQLCCIEERSYPNEDCEKGKSKALNRESIKYYNTVHGNCYISCMLGLKTGKETGRCQLKRSKFGFPWTTTWMECCLSAIQQPNKCESSVSCDGQVWSTPTNYPRGPSYPPYPVHSPTDTSPSVAMYSSACGNDTVPCEKASSPPPRDICDQKCGPRADCVVISDDEFRCEPFCEPGLELAPSRTVCVDINECQRNHTLCGIEGICRNIYQHFICDCRPGYEWKNGQCVDIDECKNKGFCVRNQCENTQGSFICICKEGYEFMHGQCVDINECTRGACPNQECINLPGSFRCACSNGFTLVDNECRVICPPGYQPWSDGRGCVDIDECKKSNECFSQACWNTPGSYKCLPHPQCPLHYHQVNSTTCQSPDRTIYITFENYNCRQKNYLPPGGDHIYQQYAKDCTSDMVDCNFELKNSPVPNLKSYFELRRSSDYAKKTVICSVYLVKPILSEMQVILQLNTTIFKPSYDYSPRRTLVPARAYIKYVNVHVYKSLFDRNP